MTSLVPPPPRPTLLDLGPVAQLRAGRLPRRAAQLLVGLLLYGLSIAMMVRGTLGLAPWDVLHSGLTRHLPLDLGGALVLVSVLVLALWLPLREVPGVGTVANGLLIGVFVELCLGVLGSPAGLVARVVLTVGGVLLNGAATAVYIGAQLGRGPRDGLMTGLARRTGGSLRLVRTVLEVTVVVIGLLGGALGPGTLLYAFSIGPVTQLLLPWVTVDLSDGWRSAWRCRGRPSPRPS